MTTGLQFDEELSRRLEATYTTPDVVARRRAVLDALGLRAGESVLDIGPGPGFLASEMAEIVGPSGRVHGIDSSESMVAMARQRCASQPWVDVEVGDATELPFPDGDFDVAVSVQVYEYLSDVPKALAELYRVLRPGGRAVVVASDWDAILWNATDRQRMKRVLAAFQEHLADPRLPRTLAPKLGQAGLTVQDRSVILQFNPEYDKRTYSAGIIDLVVPFVQGRQGISQEEAEAWAEDLRTLGESGEYFFCLNQYLFLATKPGTTSKR